jgi:glycosyltransferase involved in cell wall biosynthesis
MERKIEEEESHPNPSRRNGILCTGRPATEERTASRFAFVIPVYNHPDRVAEVIRKAVSTGLPVFVVDDGSTDRTPERIRSVKGATVLTHSVNRGKGAALLTGFTAAAASGADYAITVDADGQHDPAQASRLMEAALSHGRALVVGRREGMDDPSIPWTSRFGRKFSNFWVWASGGPGLSDTQSGYRVYPIPESLRLGVRARRFAFEVEVLVLARRKNIPVLQAPVSVDYMSGGKRISHFRPFVDFWRNSYTFTRLLVLLVIRAFTSICSPATRSGG